MYSEHASRAVPGAVVWHSVRTTDDSVLPDGCMDLVWRSGDVVVAGPDTQPFAVPGSAVPSVGLRLRPGVLPHVLGVPAAHLRDRRVLLADVIGRRAAAGFVGLEPHDAAEVFEAFVRAKLAEVGPTQPVVTETARLLAAGRSVADVADTVGLSARALHRLGTHSFGYGPKTLSGILRLQRARDLARLGTPSAAVAAECGYVDQAHLIRESRRITGRPFGDLRQPGSGANRSTPLPSGSFTVA